MKKTHNVIYNGKSYQFTFGKRGLNFSQLGVKSISELRGLSKCTGLEELELRNNKINEITDLESLTNLRTLDLSYNNITEIQGIEHLENLCSLNLSYNQINEIKNLDGLKKLESLDISGNNISKIHGLEELHNLRLLNLSKNKIKKIENLNHLSNLTKLYLSDNKINRIENIDHLYNLMKLYLRNNKIKRIENLDQLNNLETLDLDLNQQILKIENLQHLSKLKTLKLGDTSIEKIEGLDALISLERLGIGSIVKKYLDIEGLANLINLEELEIHKFYLWNENSHYQLWLKHPIQAFRFISMIKQNNYLEIEDWKQVFKDARWVFGDAFLCNNSKYQQKWLYDQCTPKILDILEKILNEPEFADIRRGYERQWEDLLEEAKKYLFQPPKILIDYTERRRMASEKSGGREFCVYAKRPDYQIDYIGMAYLIEDLIKKNIIPNINPYEMETSEELELHELKYYTSLTHIDDFSIRLTPTEEFELFFKNEMQYVGKLKLKLRLFDTDEDLLDRIGTPLGTNFMILSIPFSQEIWSDYALKDIIQDENDYYGFYRTKACQIFEKKYEKFLDSLKEMTGDEIGTGFYLKKRKKPREIRFSDLIFGKD